MKKLTRMICVVCVMVMMSGLLTSCLLIGAGVAGGVAGEMSDNISKSKVQKDKAVLAEVRQAILVTLANEDYVYAEANDDWTDVASDGTFDIEDLFDDENNYGVAEEVSKILGTDEIYLESDMNKNCRIKVYMNGREGIVVLQVVSSQYTFYLDKNGEHEGTYNE